MSTFLPLVDSPSPSLIELVHRLLAPLAQRNPRKSSKKAVPASGPNTRAESLSLSLCLYSLARGASAQLPYSSVYGEDLKRRLLKPHQTPLLREQREISSLWGLEWEGWV